MNTTNSPLDTGVTKKNKMKFELEKYYTLKLHLSELGYGKEIGWAENIKICDNSYDFANETIWVILNSGMKEQIARKIFNRIMEALKESVDLNEVFKHTGKVKAIKDVIKNCTRYFNEWNESGHNIEYLQTLPFIGKITKFHLAKNLGLDFCKPDRHLERIAKLYQSTPERLCSEIAQETGDRIGVVDIVIWRACNLKLL